MSLQNALGCIICAAVWLVAIDFAAGFQTQLDRFDVNLGQRGQPVENAVSDVVSPQSEEPYPTRYSVFKHEEDNSAIESLTGSMEDWASDRSLSRLTDTGSHYLEPNDPFEVKEQLNKYNAARKPKLICEAGVAGAARAGTVTTMAPSRVPGDKAEDMFRAIQDQRRNSKTINFVWLHLKKPDEYKAGQNAIEGLRDLARKYLQLWGVRVLYGFYRSHVDGRAFGVIRDNHNYLEAVSINDKAANVHKSFQQYGAKIQNTKRVADCGYFNLGFQFGNCSEQDYYTCTELRHAGRMRDEGNFGKVFGWTLAVDQADFANALLGTARVDGLIYGFKVTSYRDHEDTRAAFKDIQTWVQKHSVTHYLAGQDVSPW
ncbi:hypothetical protein BDV34DRAFT_221278 [Aspergillus parasiticus]|uniref:Uncharacterized protein n=2 Tax=Aspergillus parasiticus TaxID=5067 RepID=A0A5N6DX07_ASPPA|nr:hypothetical protein BDV34DRAFT_221278 [Aspergillus parasiticus]